MPRPSSDLSAVLLALDRARDYVRAAKRSETKLRKRIAQLESEMKRLREPLLKGEEQ